MTVKQTILSHLGGELYTLFSNLDDDLFVELKEIRIRVNKPVIVHHLDEELFLDIRGELSKECKTAFIVTNECIERTLERISNYSLYAFEEEIKNGYITLSGGHRVGICGKTVIENGKVKTIKNINGFNIRIAHEVKGCSNSVMRFIASPDVKHTLIISPPCCGKTTLLRDIIRQLSNGFQNIRGQAVAIVDERSEIAGSYQGVPQNDIGIRTDVLDCCPKQEGMLMLLRAMSPKVIAVDEIGRVEDIYAIEEVINAGVKMICTVHGNSTADIKDKPVLHKLIEKGFFELFIVLNAKNGVGNIEGVYDKAGNRLCT